MDISELITRTEDTSDHPVASGTTASGTPALTIDLESLFRKIIGVTPDGAELLQGREFSRALLRGRAELLIDRFGSSGIACAALRFPAGDGQRITLSITGSHQLQTAAAGGWLLTPVKPGRDSYWIPQPPVLRRLDKDCHILAHRPAHLAGFDGSAAGLSAQIDQPAGYVVDFVIWRLPAHEPELLLSLDHLTALERQRYFLWSSHTAYACPADLYLHWVHGHVYENHEVWPKYCRVCSELDAYALYLTLTGLLRATGKNLYDLLRTQVVFSVIARQAEDGGWYHGEWTGGMESHYRLVNGAVQMLTAHLEQYEDKTARGSLEKAVAFLAARSHRLDVGAWFMHDSLEANVQGMHEYPFAWSTSTALGKETTNMLILNTHLDSTIALDRYAEVTNDGQYQSLVASAKDSAMAVLMLRPSEWFYRLIFKILDLTLLPKLTAERLPLPKRIIKRIGWKYIAPSLHRLKAILPRLVMPNGFIDRSLCQKGFSTRYQSVHVWDLVRYMRRFPGDRIASVVKLALDYTYHGNMREHWRESTERQDAFGFWIEALYHFCLIDSDPKLRHWLAEAAIDAENLGLGLPPSVLGTNNEAIRLEEQRPCPVPADEGLRVINLSRGEHAEYIVVNCTKQALPLEWRIPPSQKVVWMDKNDLLNSNDKPPPLITSQGWATGISPVHA